MSPRVRPPEPGDAAVAAEHAARSDEPLVVLRNTVPHADALARALLEGRGYGVVNHFLRMRASTSTGARRLYERAGMHVARHADVHEKRLRGGGDVLVQA